MNKLILTVLILFFIASAQDITVSKDSIQVYNNPIMSFADEVVFTSHTSDSIHLDSAFVLISEIDTVGYGRNGFEASWRSNYSSAQVFVWNLDSIGPNSYRLVKNLFSPALAAPLSLSGNGATCQMFFLEIGSCFMCALYPKYPRYLRGTMRLYFSNGQVVELKLWSNDLRTAVGNRGFQMQHSALSSRLSAYRYLANGRRAVVDNRVLLRKNQVSGIKLFERKD